MIVGAKSLTRKLDLRDNAREIVLKVGGHTDEAEALEESKFLAALYRLFIKGGSIRLENNDGTTFDYATQSPLATTEKSNDSSSNK